MQRVLPPFEPPSRPAQVQPSFPEYLKQMEDWLDRYTNYMLSYVVQMTSVINTGSQGFALTNVAAATTTFITSYLTIITGAGTIATLKTSPGFSGQVVLISQGGFSTSIAGNINKAVTVAAGDAILLNYNPVTTKWYLIQ